MNSTTFVLHLNNGYEVVIVSEWKKTRDGFKHVSRAYRNGGEVGRNTSHYYNRTWEAYEFQSSARGAVRDWEWNRREEVLRIFKIGYGYKRMTQKRWAEYYEHLNEDIEYNAAREALKALDKRPETFSFAG